MNRPLRDFPRNLRFLAGVVFAEFALSGIALTGIDEAGLDHTGIWFVQDRNKQDYHGTRHHDYHLWEEPHHV